MKLSKVRASNLSHRARTNFPLLRMTAPKQATDLRVGAWNNTGTLTSGGATSGSVCRAAGNDIRPGSIVQRRRAPPPGAVFLKAATLTGSDCATCVWG